MTSWEQDGKICCIDLIKADNLGIRVKSILNKRSTVEKLSVEMYFLIL